MYLYGYRNNDVKLPSIPPTKEALIEKLDSKHDDEIRRPVAVSLGCHLKGAVSPHADMTHYSTTLGGIQKRFLMKPPQTSKNVRRRLNKFVRNWIRENLTPLSRDSDTSVETWLESTNYPRWRKDALLDTWKQAGAVLIKGKHTSVKSFIKDEFYDAEFKHPRLINSRHDMFKVAVGPFFKLIEKELFKLPWFIKKIPVNKRAQYIMDRLYKPDGTYIATDYTAYETHFSKEMMNAVEFELYKYMTSELPESAYFNDLLKVISGKNQLYGHNFHVELEATRMSGEMNTSLGNGFSNLMFMLFACQEAGSINPIGVIEGDDGLFCMDGPQPTKEMFEKMGLTIKLEVLKDISSASFCGLIFDPVDLVNITNPIHVLTSFGWTDRKYCGANKKKLMALLRSKSLSMLYEYQNAPIFQALARYGLRMTEGVRAVSAYHYNLYEREMYQAAYAFYNKHSHILYKPVPLNTRLLMEREFGLSVESQLRIETYLDNLTGLQPLHLEIVTYMAPDDAKEMWCKFVAVHERNSPDRYIRTS